MFILKNNILALSSKFVPNITFWLCVLHDQWLMHVNMVDESDQLQQSPTY